MVFNILDDLTGNFLRIFQRGGTFLGLRLIIINARSID